MYETTIVRRILAVVENGLRGLSDSEYLAVLEGVVEDCQLRIAAREEELKKSWYEEEKRKE